MRKGTIIARCLVNSGFAQDEKEAEDMVLRCFHECYPEDNFSKWNSNINNKSAENIIEAVDRASRINVEKFIRTCGNDFKVTHYPNSPLLVVPPALCYQ